MKRGCGILPQQPIPLRTLARLSGDLQQSLGVPSQVVGDGLREAQAAAHLVPDDDGAMHLAAAPDIRTTHQNVQVVRMSAGWIDSRLHSTVRRARATSRRVFGSSNQSSQMMITVAVVRRLVVTSGIPSAP